MTPEDLLAETDRLLVGVVPGVAGSWPRACVWLIRLALERGLDRYWAEVRPEIAACGMLLPRFAAWRPLSARQAWSDLSRAAHHHPYEAAPTARELRRWHGQVTTVVTDLARTPRLAGTSGGSGDSSGRDAAGPARRAEVGDLGVVSPR